MKFGALYPSGRVPSLSPEKWGCKDITKVGSLAAVTLCEIIGLTGCLISNGNYKLQFSRG